MVTKPFPGRNRWNAGKWTNREYDAELETICPPKKPLQFIETWGAR
jgi:hypothetical protein